MQRRVCISCLEQLAPPGHVKCQECDSRNGHPPPPEPFTGLSPDLARQLQQAGIDPNAAIACLQLQA
jgi:hypothetical protein